MKTNDLVTVGVIIFGLLLTPIWIKIGVNLSGYSKEPVIHESDKVHYADYVEIVRGFYTGTKGTVLKKDTFYSRPGMIQVYVDRGNYDHEIIDVKYRDCRKTSRKEVNNE